MARNDRAPPRPSSAAGRRQRGGSVGPQSTGQNRFQHWMDLHLVRLCVSRHRTSGVSDELPPPLPLWPGTRPWLRPPTGPTSTNVTGRQGYLAVGAHVADIGSDPRQLGVALTDAAGRARPGCAPEKQVRGEGE